MLEEENRALIWTKWTRTNRIDSMVGPVLVLVLDVCKRKIQKFGSRTSWRFPSCRTRTRTRTQWFNLQLILQKVLVSV